jgi:hypothetical protein
MTVIAERRSIMIRRLAFLVVAAALLICADRAQAQTLVGSLDCRFTSRLPKTLSLPFLPGRAVRCTFLPEGGGAVARFVGRLQRSGVDPVHMAGDWVAWGVYSRQPGFTSAKLKGHYEGSHLVVLARLTPRGLQMMAESLYGGLGNSIELHPLAPTPGETPSVNFAFGTTALDLR